MLLFFLTIVCKAICSQPLKEKETTVQETESEKAEEKQIRVIAGIILIPFVVAFSFAVFVLYRRKRESFFKQKEAELAREISETEMKALRSQINPHFIFNCLNSIYNNMQKNEVEIAGEYLLKFSKLMRMVLENSAHHEVPIADDIEVLELYIQLEQMRGINKFKYSISVDPALEIEDVHVPPLIIQPFVENSIKHGMNHADGSGQINIIVKMEKDGVRFEITDNCKHAEVPKEKTLFDEIKKTSMGLSITDERLKLLGKITGKPTYYSITDLKNPEGKNIGKKVELVVPFRHN